MSFNHDYTRKDGTEVLVRYRFRAGCSDYFSGGCWNPGDAPEIEFDKVYGLPDGEKLTDDEWDEIEAAIFVDPPEYSPEPDDVF